MSNVVFFQNVRVSFPHLTQPHSASPDGSNPKYSCDIIFAPNDPAYAKFTSLYQSMAAEEWGAQAQNVLAFVQQDRRLRCYGDGAEKLNKQTMQPYDGYPGMAFIAANNSAPPQFVGDDGQPVDPGATMQWQTIARKIYGGCYANVAVKPWLQNNSHGQAVRCDLVAIQFAADGEPFGESAGAPDVSGMFGQVATPAGAAAPIPGAGVAANLPPAAPAATATAAPVAAPAAPSFAPGTPMAPPGAMAPPAAPAAAPVQGADGVWYDPATGQPVTAPVMPGYPQP